MRIGTPGFVGARLTEAREARGHTQSALAEITGIKPQSISHYEQGRQSPSPDALVLLSRALHLPERFFLRAAHDSATSCISIPQHHPKAAERIARTQAARRAVWAVELAEYLSRYVDLPATKLPVKCEGDAEQTAMNCRAALRLGAGPADDLLALTEDAGCIVTCMKAYSDLPAAWSWWSGDRPYIVVSPTACSAELTYAVACELGRLIGGPDADAGRFARALLMPARAFADDLWATTVDALLTMKKDWHCPVAEMVTRCGELGLFNPDQLKRASASLMRRGRKWIERSDEEWETETPSLLAKCVGLLLDSGLKDRHSLLSDLAVSAADVEEMCALPSGYLTAAHSHSGHAHAELRLRASELRRVDSPHIVIA